MGAPIGETMKTRNQKCDEAILFMWEYTPLKIVLHKGMFTMSYFRLIRDDEYFWLPSFFLQNGLVMHRGAYQVELFEWGTRR